MKKIKTRNATKIMLKRCQKCFFEKSNEYKLAEQAINDDSLPLDKISRWLGYLQGILIFNGIMDVETERDFSRPLFMEAYKTEEPHFYKIRKG